MFMMIPQNYMIKDELRKFDIPSGLRKVEMM